MKVRKKFFELSRVSKHAIFNETGLLVSSGPVLKGVVYTFKSIYRVGLFS